LLGGRGTPSGRGAQLGGGRDPGVKNVKIKTGINRNQKTLSSIVYDESDLGLQQEPKARRRISRRR